MIQHGRDLTGIESSSASVAGTMAELPSPYAKTYLLPDMHKITKRKTRVIKKNANPTFMEMLVYRLPLQNVQNRLLQVLHSYPFPNSLYSFVIVSRHYDMLCCIWSIHLDTHWCDMLYWLKNETDWILNLSTGVCLELWSCAGKFLPGSRQHSPRVAQSHSRKCWVVPVGHSTWVTSALLIWKISKCALLPFRCSRSELKVTSNSFIFLL